MSDLTPFRRRLDELDEEIVRLLGARFDTCREIAMYKRAHDIPMMQYGRVEQVRARYLARGAEVRLPVDFTSALFELMIDATCSMEDELMAALSQEELEEPAHVTPAGEECEQPLQVTPAGEEQ
jgi:chorismate mutase